MSKCTSDKNVCCILTFYN